MFILKVMNYKISSFTIFLIWLMLIGLLVLLINLISPGDFGVWGVLLVSVLIYLIFFALIMLIARGATAVASRVNGSGRRTEARIQQIHRRQVWLSAVLAATPVFLMLGQMRWWYVALTFLLELVLIFLVVRKV